MELEEVGRSQGFNVVFTNDEECEDSWHCSYRAPEGPEVGLPVRRPGQLAERRGESGALARRPCRSCGAEPPTSSSHTTPDGGAEAPPTSAGAPAVAAAEAAVETKLTVDQAPWRVPVRTCCPRTPPGSAQKCARSRTRTPPKTNKPNEKVILRKRTVGVQVRRLGSPLRKLGEADASSSSAAPPKPPLTEPDSGQGSEDQALQKKMILKAKALMAKLGGNASEDECWENKSRGDTAMGLKLRKSG